MKRELEKLRAMKEKRTDQPEKGSRDSKKGRSEREDEKTSSRKDKKPRKHEEDEKERKASKTPAPEVPDDDFFHILIFHLDGTSTREKIYSTATVQSDIATWVTKDEHRNDYLETPLSYCSNGQPLSSRK